MNINFIVGFIDDDKSFVDSADVESRETAKEEIEEIIKEFNETESRQYGENAQLRKLLKILND